MTLERMGGGGAEGRKGLGRVEGGERGRKGKGGGGATDRGRLFAD